jgi:hypothetical protein
MHMKCDFCEDSGWVCKRHLERPWDGDSACGCGAPCALCPACNAANDRAAPRMPDGFKTDIDKKGWRH